MLPLGTAHMHVAHDWHEDWAFVWRLDRLVLIA